MTAQACWLHDRGRPAGEAANEAKYAAAEAACAAVDAAIQTHGGNGMSTEYGLIPLWGIARLLRIAPVSREMVLNYVAQHSLGLPRSYSPAAGALRKEWAWIWRATSSSGSMWAITLTRSAAARPDQLAVVDGPAVDLCGVQRLGQPDRARTGRPRLHPGRRAGPGLGQQRGVPRHLLRLRQAGPGPPRLKESDSWLRAFREIREDRRRLDSRPGPVSVRSRRGRPPRPWKLTLPTTIRSTSLDTFLASRNQTVHKRKFNSVRQSSESFLQVYRIPDVFARMLFNSSNIGFSRFA